MNTSLQTAASSFLQDGLDKLHALGMKPNDTEVAPIIGVLERIASKDNSRAVLIGRTLASQEFFDQIVSKEISKITYGSRQNKIAERFTSIREDAQRFVNQAEKNNIGLADRLSNIAMKIRRGDISDRFDTIRSTQDQINKDVHHQLMVESIILEAYADFRNSLKFAEVQSLELQAEINEETARFEVEHQNVQKALDAIASGDKEKIKKEVFAHKMRQMKRMEPDAYMPNETGIENYASVQAQYELNRDIAFENLKKAKERQRLAERLTQNIQTAYAVTTVTMAKLVQFHESKQKVYDESVTFMSTSGSILSALKATYSGLMGLHEATAALDTMQTEISASMKTLSGLGDTVTENAMRKVNGPIIDANAVKAVIESIVSYQTKSIQISKEMREKSAQNIAEIKAAMEDGKRNITDLIAREKVAGL